MANGIPQEVAGQQPAAAPGMEQEAGGAPPNEGGGGAREMVVQIQAGLAQLQQAMGQNPQFQREAEALGQVRQQFETIISQLGQPAGAEGMPQEAGGVTTPEQGAANVSPVA